MELLLITAILSFEKEIRQILKKSEVKSYSQMDVKGYKDVSGEPQNANWFAASTQGEHRSILFLAFVPKENVKEITDTIVQLNQSQETHSYVHAAVLGLKKII